MTRRLAPAFALALAVAACGGSSTTPAPVTPAAAPTAPAAPAPATPTAEQILEAHLEATGGREAHAGLTAMRARGTVSLEPIGVSGTIELLIASGSRSRTRLDLTGIGLTETGTDGTIAWEKSALTGARILDGAERTRALRDALLDADLRWRELYPKVELAGEAELEGRPAWKLLMTDPEGQVKTRYFDRETRLELGSEETLRTQAGDVPVKNKILEHQRFGAILVPSRTVQHAQGIDLVVTIESVEWNPTVPPDAFALPPEVAKLKK